MNKTVITLSVISHLALTYILINSLSIESWIDPDCCVSDCWFRQFAISSGFIVGVTYSIFAFLFRYKWRETFNKLTGSYEFGDSLAIVFILCAFCHSVHGLSYYTKYAKPSLLVFYPPLIFHHFRLILMTERVDKHIKALKTPQEYAILQSKIIDILQKRSKETKEKFIKGFDKVSFADIGKLRLKTWEDLAPGVRVYLEIYEEKYFKLLCVMNPLKNTNKVELLTHEHPDYDEKFKITKGILYDKLSGTKIKQGESYLFGYGIPHNPYSLDLCEMEIEGFRI